MTSKQEKILKLLGFEFKVLRQKEGIKQEELAEKIDMEKRVISRFENGNTVSIETILKLCEYFDVTLMAKWGD